jgi:hypothetical protein
MMLSQQINIKEYIWQNMKDLPDESLNEILNFVIFTRKSIYEPQLFQINFENLHE